MTKFQFCVSYILDNEGEEYTNDPNDRGGCTKWGITLKELLTDPFMSHIRSCEDLKHMTRMDAVLVYYRRYWKFYGITDWRSAAKMMDIYVNLPPGSAIHIFQRAANACGAQLKVDGLYGDKTEAAINGVASSSYLAELIDQLHTYYEQVVTNSPSQAVFIKGWLNRAHKLPEGTSGKADIQAT